MDIKFDFSILCILWILLAILIEISAITGTTTDSLSTGSVSTAENAPPVNSATATDGAPISTRNLTMYILIGVLCGLPVIIILFCCIRACCHKKEVVEKDIGKTDVVDINSGVIRKN